MRKCWRGLVQRIDGINGFLSNHLINPFIPHYQKAQVIKIEFKDKYEQASTYHGLGVVAEEQEQWQQAKDYLLKALSLWAEFNGSYGIETFSLPAFARLHQATNDDTLPAAVAEVLGVSVKKATEKLQTAIKGKPTIAPKIAEMMGMTAEEIMEQQRSMFGTDDPKIIRRKLFSWLAIVGGVLGSIIGYFFGGLKGSLIGFFIGGLGLPLLLILVGLFIRLLIFIKSTK